METDMSLSPDDEVEQDPTVQLWLYYYISQHKLYTNQPVEALEIINKAIQHTPTVCDLFFLKADIMNTLGNREQAAALAEEGRGLDQQDRNCNYESSRYHLKINDIEKCDELMGLFSYDVWKGGDLNMHEM
jgi:hypothetical protein